MVSCSSFGSGFSAFTRQTMMMPVTGIPAIDNLNRARAEIGTPDSRALLRNLKQREEKDLLKQITQLEEDCS